MQQECPEVFQKLQGPNTPLSPPTSLQYGLQDLTQGSSAPFQLQQCSRSVSPQPTAVTGRGSPGASLDSITADQLDQKLRGLNVEDGPSTPGRRISEYENALTPSTPRQALGFKVIKRASPSSDGPQLADFPNGSWLDVLGCLVAIFY